jgi:uncharacterized protein
MQSVVIAYSGGLDSTFLLKTAVDALGKPNVLAVTARSETYPASEYREALKYARSIGARHLTITTDELKMPDFVSNPVERCYHCKKELFGKLDGIRRARSLKYVLDGTNYDDLKDIRYGRRAAKEACVLSPLLDAGITKDDIRKYSKRLGLATWDKPSYACLASRIPFGTAINPHDLGKIDRAELYLREAGFGQVRVRMHGNIARIEFCRREFMRAVKMSDAIVKKMKALGFVYVTLDLDGYRTGSMHEA